MGDEYKKTDFGYDDHINIVCPECGKTHKTIAAWRRHLNIDHDYANKTVEDFDFIEIDSRYHECTKCGKWVANAHANMALLQYHRFTHLPYNRAYRCKYCDASFVRKVPLCDHIFQQHIDHLIKAKNATNLSLTKTIKSTETQAPNTEYYMRFLCPQCMKEFELFKQWLDHINIAHACTSKDLKFRRLNGTKDSMCLICNQVVHDSTHENLQRHHFTHLPCKLYFQCAFCTIKKNSKTELFRHFLFIHPDKVNNAECLLKKPVEWAATISDNKNEELDMLLKNFKIYKKPQTESFQGFDKIDLDQTLATLEAKVMKQKRIIQGINKREEKSGFQNFCFDAFSNILNAKKKGATLDADTALNESSENKLMAITVEDGKFDQRLIINKPKKKNANTNNEMRILCEKFIRYLCPECGQEFKRLNFWRSHVFKEHSLSTAVQKNFKLLENGSSYLCISCLHVLNTIKTPDLQRHYFMHMPFQSYLKCAICGVSKSSKPKMLTHLQIIHGIDLENELTSYCSKPNANSGLESNCYWCKTCGKRNVTKFQLKKHRAICLMHPYKINRNFDDVENKKIIVHLDEAYKRIKSCT